MAFERQADFATGDVSGASFDLRPDAVVSLVSPAPGPSGIGVTASGIFYKGWYARPDNDAGKVWICASNGVDWNPETELFSFTGDDIDMLSLAFDKAALPVVAMERAGSLWVRYHNGSSYQLTNLGTGTAPALLHRAPDSGIWSELYLFYQRGTTVYYRLGSDDYATEYDASATLAADQNIWRAILGSQERMHLILSTRDAVAGTHSLQRISTDVLAAACLDAEGYADRIDDGTITILIFREDGTIWALCDIEIDALIVAAGGDSGGISRAEDSKLWVSALGAGLTVGVDTPPDEHIALGGGDGGINDVDGQGGGSGGGGGGRSPSGNSMWTAGGLGSSPQGYAGGGGQSTWGLLDFRTAAAGAGGGYGGPGTGGTCLGGSPALRGKAAASRRVPGWAWFGPKGGEGHILTIGPPQTTTGNISGGGGGGGVRTVDALAIPGGEVIPIEVGQGSITTAAAGRGGRSPGGPGVTGLVAVRIERVFLDDLDWAEFTGGVETDWGEYRYHTFLASGTLTLVTAGKAEAILQGPGGGGGSGCGAGGGGGDFRSIVSYFYKATEAVTLGTPGAGGVSGGAGDDGEDTTLGEHATAWGGGGGAGASGAAGSRATGGGGHGTGGDGGAGAAMRGYPGGPGGGFDKSAGGSAASAGGGGGNGEEGYEGAVLETQGDELTDNWEVPSTFEIDVGGQFLNMASPDNDAMLHNAIAALNQFVQVRVMTGTNQTVIGPICRAEHPTADPDEAPTGYAVGMNPFADKVYLNAKNVTYVCGVSEEHVGQLYCTDGVQQSSFHPIDNIAGLKRLADTSATYNGVAKSAGVWCLHSPATNNAHGLCFELLICGGGDYAKHVLCGNMPTGGSLEVLDIDGNVVGSATESGGEAKVDLSCYGNGTTGIQKRVPYEGFASMRAKNSGGTVVASIIASIYPGGEYDVDGSVLVVREDPGDSATEPFAITGLLARSRFDELTPGPDHGDGGAGLDIPEPWPTGATGFGSNGRTGGGAGGGAELFIAGVGGDGGGGDGGVDTDPPTDGAANTGGGGGGSGDSTVAGGDGGSGYIVVRSKIPMPPDAELVLGGLISNHDAHDITGLEDSDALSAWLDSGPNGYHITGLNSPLYRDGIVEHINGHPCVRTGGAGNANLRYDDAIVSGLTQGEIFAIRRVDKYSDLNGFAYFNLIDYINAVPYTDNHVYDNWGRYNQIDAGVIGATAMLNPHLYNVSSKTNEWTVRLNGTQIFQTLTNTPSFGTFQPRIAYCYEEYAGLGHRIRYTTGVYGQVLVYDHVLSVADRAAVVAYLNWRWSLGL
jgi:hypothetical protein